MVKNKLTKKIVAAKRIFFRDHSAFFEKCPNTKYPTYIKPIGKGIDHFNWVKCSNNGSNEATVNHKIKRYHWSHLRKCGRRTRNNGVNIYNWNNITKNQKPPKKVSTKSTLNWRKLAIIWWWKKTAQNMYTNVHTSHVTKTRRILLL